MHRQSPLLATGLWAGGLGLAVGAASGYAADRVDRAKVLLTTGLWAGGLGLAVGAAAGYAAERADRARLLRRCDAAADAILAMAGGRSAASSLDHKLGSAVIAMQRQRLPLAPRAIQKPAVG